MAISIRKASVLDAQEIFDIRIAAIRDQCKNYYSEPALDSWTSGTPSERFRADVEQSFYVATKNDTIIGTGMVSLDSGQLDAIFVHPAYLRQGVGRAMVAFLENIARINGVSCLKLDSTLNAASFYRSLGFKGTQVSKYITTKGMELACIPMKKEIPNTAK